MISLTLECLQYLFSAYEITDTQRSIYKITPGIRRDRLKIKSLTLSPL